MSLPPGGPSHPGGTTAPPSVGELPETKTLLRPLLGPLSSAGTRSSTLKDGIHSHRSPAEQRVSSNAAFLLTFSALSLRWIPVNFRTSLNDVVIQTFSSLAEFPPAIRDGE